MGAGLGRGEGRKKGRKGYWGDRRDERRWRGRTGLEPIENRLVVRNRLRTA